MATTPSGRIPEGMIQLGPELWLDLEGGLLIRQQQEILLTARETAILSALVQALFHSRCYLSAQAIATRINLSEMQDQEHSVEQTMSSIRRKLGEELRHPRILRGRRGFGYRLFPEIPPE